MSDLPAALPLPISSVPTAGVDLVISYSISSKESKDKKVLADYELLISRIKGAGLEVIARPGAKDTVLLLIRGPLNRITEEAKRERMADWIYGVSSNRPEDFKIESVTSADRVRFVHSILVTPIIDQNSLISSTLSGPTAGITKLEFPNIQSIFAVHDDSFNNNWMKAVRGLKQITDEEIDQLHSHFGSEVTFYFAFLSSYFNYLLFPAFFGFGAWFLDQKHSIAYSIALVVWSIVFLESWKIKEKNLCVKWNTYGLENLPDIRSDYKGDRVQKSSWFNSIRKQAVVLPVLGLYSAGMASLITSIYVLETIIGEVYDGAGKRFLTLLPTVLFVGLVGQLSALWHNVATNLTIYENPKSNSTFKNFLTFKLLAINLLTAYGGLLLSVYVYIPFGQALLPKILSLMPLDGISVLSSGSSYTINSVRLETQLIAYTLTGQISGAFVEMVIPFALRYIGRLREGEEKREGIVTKDTVEEQELLKSIIRQASLPDYQLYPEYVEMILQFGYIVLFSVIWPLAPLMAFINNFFEQRGDAFKLCRGSKRPIPVRASSIGPWLSALTFLSWSASMTNASIVYLFSPVTIPYTSPKFLNLLSNSSNSSVIFSNGQPHSITTTALKINTLTSTLGESGGGIFQILGKAILIAFISEHSFLLLQWVIRLVLTSQWNDSREKATIYEADLIMRRKCLEGIKVEKIVVTAIKSSGGMWDHDEGLDILTSRSKLD